MNKQKLTFKPDAKIYWDNNKMKNILISGGSKGVGLALITPFAQKNYNVILFIINLKRP
ncbi:MAG: hypothetical protein K0R94_264 [Burkholderiales bacterium]|nr:hypothetical protein [Burkholderiales bacterium]